jgi:replicative DNA helicase
VSTPRRVPPYSEETERALVGALMLRSSLIIDVAEVGLGPDDFYVGKWGAAFAAIVALVDRGEPVDPLTVDEELTRQGGPRPDAADLNAAQSEVPSTGHAVAYAKRVLDYARVRSVLAAAAEVIERGYDPSARGDADEFADWAEATVFAAGGAHAVRDAPVPIGEAVDAALFELRERAAGKAPGVATGLADLDRTTGGMRVGQLWVVGARPAIGKSALAFGIALHVAEQCGPVLVASAEMGRIELAMRALTGGGVPSDRLLTGRLDETDFERLAARGGQLANLMLFIDDSAGIRLGSIRARARRLAARGGLALVVVDYVQLVAAEAHHERRELEVAEVSRGLKATARELGIPVLAVAQLNRGVDLRSDKRPQLADLRESGQLEQDADLVAMLHRPALYDSEADPGVAELIVAKHRNGPTGTIPLTWLPSRMAFRNTARNGRG